MVNTVQPERTDPSQASLAGFFGLHCRDGLGPFKSTILDSPAGIDIDRWEVCLAEVSHSAGSRASRIPNTKRETVRDFKRILLSYKVLLSDRLKLLAAEAPQPDPEEQEALQRFVRPHQVSRKTISVEIILSI
jgi:hypothetical protein